MGFRLRSSGVMPPLLTTYQSMHIGNKSTQNAQGGSPKFNRTAKVSKNVRQTPHRNRVNRRNETQGEYHNRTGNDKM